ncbi:MAG: peptidase [Chloroflexi bacterium]|nr:peptidase [Chloroflexota bacterium]
MHNRKGLIALVGSGEYLPQMEGIDRWLLAHCGADGRKPRVACVPTAAGREGEASIARWSQMGVNHFTRLDAEVQAVPVLDRQSADSKEYALIVQNADVVYFSGGDPGYLLQTLEGSRVWKAVWTALEAGGVYAGCSAGAMIAGREFPDFRRAGLRSIKAFGLVPAKSIIPHFDAIPSIWRPLIFALLRRLKPDELALGIDENTALVGREGDVWTVMGQGQVHVFKRGSTRNYSEGETMTFGD